MNDLDARINKIVEHYSNDETLKFKQEMIIENVQKSFEKNPAFNVNGHSVIHSIRSRIKDPEHLRDKLKRKSSSNREITVDNYLTEITDLVGVRVLFLFQNQFKIIHEGILEWIKNNGWKLVEEPKAYTWDPEMEKIYESMNINHEMKDSHYTSVHYVIKPDNDYNDVCCEIQIRTLFEEVWGEMDHTINYPYKTESVACQEQLKVMAKLVSSGTRLCESIFRSYEEHKNTHTQIGE